MALNQLNIQDMRNTMMNGLNNSELQVAQLTTDIGNSDGPPSTQSLLNLQFAISNYGIMATTQSDTQKGIFDTLKQIVNNIAQ